MIDKVEERGGVLRSLQARTIWLGFLVLEGKRERRGFTFSHMPLINEEGCLGKGRGFSSKAGRGAS